MTATPVRHVQPPSESGHPSWDELVAFARGAIRESDAMVVQRHVMACDECCLALEQVADDSLMRLVSRAHSDNLSPRTPRLRLVPGYEILEELGRGGMGVVFKARQVELNRFVALKMIRQGAAADARELARLHVEAKSVAQLKHPHIVQVFDVGEQDGQPFLAMEYIHGVSLAQWLAERPHLPTAPLAAQMVETLALAVQHAHEQGIVHRDLKPANIMLSSPDGMALKITDFGLAKRLDSGFAQSLTGTVVGTPPYMSPEQAGGRVDDVGPCTDVYALGVILYELLTGQPPFRGSSTIETLELVRHVDPLPPARLRPDLPRDLQTICLKCLMKHPPLRYRSARDLADDLRRFLADEPILARPVNLLVRAGKWARRNRATCVVFASLTVLVVGTVAGLAWHNGRLDIQVQRAEAAALDARLQKSIALENFRQGYDVVDDLLRQIERQGRTLGRTDLFEIQRRTAWRRAERFFGAALRDANSNDPEIQLAQVIAQNYLGICQHMRGDTTNARRNLEQARAGLEKFTTSEVYLSTRLQNLRPDQIPFDVGYQLARCHLWLGHCERDSNPHGALAYYDRSRQLLEPLLEARPESLRTREKLAECCIEIARMHLSLNVTLGMEHAYRRALTHCQYLIEAEPDEDYFRIMSVSTKRWLAICQYLNNQDDEAQLTLHEATTLVQPLLGGGVAHTEALIERAEIHRLSAVLMIRAVRFDDALNELDSGIDELAQISPTDPRYGLVRPVLGSLYDAQSQVFRTLERDMEAEAAQQQARSVIEDGVHSARIEVDQQAVSAAATSNSMGAKNHESGTKLRGSLLLPTAN